MLKFSKSESCLHHLQMSGVVRSPETISLTLGPDQSQYSETLSGHSLKLGATAKVACRYTL